MNNGSWTPEEEKFVRENIEKLPIREICDRIGKSEMAIKLYLHRNKISVGKTIKRNIVKEILTIKFIKPEYFHPTREFYKAVKINQMRWWDLYYGRKPITEEEYIAIVEHFQVTVKDAFFARQINLFEQEDND